MLGLLGGAVAQTCNTFQDTDIDPHTPGMGSVAASDIQTCCETCASAAWYNKGCRFYTLSKGRCWFKTNNGTVVHSPGVIGGHATSPAPPPPPLPPWPKRSPVDWTKVGPLMDDSTLKLLTGDPSPVKREGRYGPWVGS